MGISLKNAMKLGKLSNCNVIAGHNGLDKIIENVTVMDVPDVVKWLKGGELVLTSLFDNMFHEIEQSEINALSIENCPKMLSGMIRNKICIIVLLEERSQESVCREIYDHFEKNTPNSIELFSAVGEIYEGPRGIRKSFYQAEQAYNIMRQNKKSDEIVFHKDLGVYRFLPHLIGTRELQEFYNDTIGTLLNEDPKRELMYTLKVYFENNEVIKATSDELYIHVNTLKYRLKRIEQITGLNLKKVEDKVRLFIGLKIYELTDENSL